MKRIPKIIIEFHLKTWHITPTYINNSEGTVIDILFLTIIITPKYYYIK